MSHRYPHEYYRKRKDPEAKAIARQCGVEYELNVLGDTLHRSDLWAAIGFLGVREETALSYFFEPVFK